MKRAPGEGDPAGQAHLRALLVTPRFRPAVGGVEAHVEGIAAGLRQTGAHVTVVTQAAAAGSRTDPDGVHVVELREAVRSQAYPVAPGLFPWLRRHAGEHDVVHAHSYHAAPALAAAVATPGALVFTPHYHGGGHTAFARLLHLGYQHAGRRIFRRADAVIAVSHAEAELIAAHHPAVADRISVVPNGVDAERIRAAEPFDLDHPVVLVIGRLEPYKRVDAVVRAMAGRASDAELVVIGDGPGRSGLEQLARGLGTRATFAGRVDAATLHRWLRSAAVVVSASRHEAFGLTLLEGLTAGARVVASDIPAHREVGERFGPPGGVVVVDPAAPAGQLREAIDQQLGAGRLADGDRPAWSWTGAAAATTEVYRQVLEAGAC